MLHSRVRRSVNDSLCGVSGLEVDQNLCHGSDSTASAAKEIALWLRPEDLVRWVPYAAKRVWGPDKCVLADPKTGECLVENSGDVERDRVRS